jgi:hypothetical protein
VSRQTARILYLRLSAKAWSMTCPRRFCPRFLWLRANEPIVCRPYTGRATSHSYLTVDRPHTVAYTRATLRFTARLCVATVGAATAPGQVHSCGTYRLCRRLRKPSTVSASAVDWRSAAARTLAREGKANLLVTAADRAAHVRHTIMS